MNASLLTGSHLRTYQTIFQHPAAHNLGWHEVHALFRELGSVEAEPNGTLKVTRNGQTLVLHPPHTKEVADTAELMTLRHFLERSEAAAPASAVAEARWLLVIDRREARIFDVETPGAVTLQISPHAPAEHFNAAPHAKEFSRGQEKPDSASFFAPVAAALAGTGRILVFGHGKGTGSEMVQFVAWAKEHQPELAARIIGSLVVDGSHLSRAQLLERAREFAAQPGDSGEFF